MELLFKNDEEKHRVREAWCDRQIVHAVFGISKTKEVEVAQVFRAEHPHMGVAKDMYGYEIIGGARLSQKIEEWVTFSLNWISSHLLEDVRERERLMRETRHALHALFATSGEHLHVEGSSIPSSAALQSSQLPEQESVQVPQEQPLSAAQ